MSSSAGPRTPVSFTPSLDRATFRQHLNQVAPSFPSNRFLVWKATLCEELEAKINDAVDSWSEDLPPTGQRVLMWAATPDDIKELFWYACGRQLTRCAQGASQEGGSFSAFFAHLLSGHDVIVHAIGDLFMPSARSFVHDAVQIEPHVRAVRKEGETDGEWLLYVASCTVIFGELDAVGDSGFLQALERKCRDLAAARLRGDAHGSRGRTWRSPASLYDSIYPDHTQHSLAARSHDRLNARQKAIYSIPRV
ncbi:hypothetical protein JCM11491_000438 [Sporobolomyces phaffii]